MVIMMNLTKNYLNKIIILEILKNIFHLIYIKLEVILSKIKITKIILEFHYILRFQIEFVLKLLIKILFVLGILLKRI